MAVNACNRTWIIAPMLCLPATAALAEKAERDLTGFRAISVSGGIDLEVHQSDHYKAGVTLPTLQELTASGGSDIRYEGRPQQTDVRTSCGSDIKLRRQFLTLAELAH